MDELERLGLDDEFGVVYDNEVMQKTMINTARNWGYDDGREERSLVTSFFNPDKRGVI